MGVTGTKFMTLTKAARLCITDHAMERIAQYAGIAPTPGLAQAFFERSIHVRHEELRAMGYRPAYGERIRHGRRSWYFQFQVFGDQLIAVLTEGDRTDEFVWVTTYGRNAQTEWLDCTATGRLAAMAG